MQLLDSRVTHMRLQALTLAPHQIEVLFVLCTLLAVTDDDDMQEQEQEQEQCYTGKTGKTNRMINFGQGEDNDEDGTAANATTAPPRQEALRR